MSGGFNLLEAALSMDLEISSKTPLVGKPGELRVTPHTHGC